MAKQSPFTSVMGKIEELDNSITNINLSNIPGFVDRKGSSTSINSLIAKLSKVRDTISPPAASAATTTVAASATSNKTPASSNKTPVTAAA